MSEKVDKVETKHSEDELKLFQKFKMNKLQIVMFDHLKNGYNKETKLCDEYLIWCIVVKKKEKKIRKTMKHFRFVIDTYKWGSIKLKKKHLELLCNGYLCYDPNFLTKNGNVALFASLKKFNKMGCTDQEMMEAYFIFIDRLMKKHPTMISIGFIAAIDLGSFRISDIPWDLKKTFSPIMLKLPMKFHAAYYLRCPWYFKICIAIMRPFLSRKLLARLHVLKDIEALRKLNIFNKLPSIIGGNEIIDPVQGVIGLLQENEDDKKVIKEFLEEREKKNKNVKEVTVKKEDHEKVKEISEEEKKELEKLVGNVEEMDEKKSLEIIEKLKKIEKKDELEVK